MRRPGIREEIVVAAVIYAANPSFFEIAIDELLVSVPRLEYVDTIIVGGATAMDLLPRLHGAEELRARKRGRTVGASFHDRRAALTAFSGQLVDIAFIRYNPVHPGARDDLFLSGDPTSKTLLFNFKSSSGHLADSDWRRLGLSPDHWRPSIADYYRFALTRSRLDGLLCSLGTPAEVRMLAEAMEEGPMSQEEEDYLTDLALLATGRARLEAATESG
jgi:hypothetical protein